MELLRLILCEQVDNLSAPCCRLVCRAWHDLLRERPSEELQVRTYLKVEWGLVSFCTALAGEGRLNVLRWALAKGHRWDSSTCGAAAGGGHLSVLAWPRSMGCWWGESTCAEAAGGGHFELLKWAREHGCSCPFGCGAAATKGDLGLRANEVPWGILISHAAAREGRLEILRWAKEQGCRMDSQVLDEALRGGQIEVLKWAIEKIPGPWNPQLAMVAAESGRLDVLP